MCGRFALLTHAEALIERFGVEEVIKRPEPRYNIAPTQNVTVVVQREKIQLTEMRWGLIPFWSKDVSIGNRMINARSETVAEKPAFRSAFKKRRCLILADGFYEWQKVGRIKIPTHIRMKDREPFAFAGLYEYWKTKSGKMLESCTIITTSPNELMSSIHQRMPVIMSLENEAAWLDPENQDVSELMSMLKPYSPNTMEAFEVSDFVNSPGNQGPLCIKPVQTQLIESSEGLSAPRGSA
ncbi:MAG: SOS response-associated peptidase [Candidatus Thorarchaeota archaeon]|jgi:putative SOS response-associated peptidase YedK